MSEALTEPWLRGESRAGFDPVVLPVLHALQQAREDLARYTENLSDEELWADAHGLGSVGFHLRHIAGSVERLTTYLRGGALTETQLGSQAAEKNPGAGRTELLSAMEASFAAFEKTARAINPSTFADARFVGRKRLPTTVVGLIIHVAEHTQRHVGQAITMCKLASAKKISS